MHYITSDSLRDFFPESCSEQLKKFLLESVSANISSSLRKAKNSMLSSNSLIQVINRVIFVAMALFTALLAFFEAPCRIILAIPAVVICCISNDAKVAESIVSGAFQTIVHIIGGLFDAISFLLAMKPILQTFSEQIVFYPVSENNGRAKYRLITCC